MSKSLHNISYNTIDELQSVFKSQKTYYLDCQLDERGTSYDILVMFWDTKKAYATSRVLRVPIEAIDRYVLSLLHKYGKLGLRPDKVFGVRHGVKFVRNDNSITNNAKDQKNGKGNRNEQTTQSPIRSYSESQTSESKGFVI